MPTGIYKRTEENTRKQAIRLREMAIARIGTKRPPRSKEWSKKLGLANKGRKKSDKAFKFQKGHPNYNLAHSEKTKRKISLSMGGTGVAKKYRESRRDTGTYEYKQWRIKVFVRDNFTCQSCQLRGCYIQAHHLKSWAKFPKLRFVVENGVTLCKPCHLLANKEQRKNERQ